jgi:hypothetical protein
MYIMLEVAFVAGDYDGEYYNFGDVLMSKNNDEHLIYYNWLADNATTSHVGNRREDFVSYTPLQNVSVTGMGGKVTKILRRGMVKLIAACNGENNLLTLNDILHIPRQPHNLISLGRWNKAGGRYSADGETLTLTTQEDITIAHGKLLKNHLCKMEVWVFDPERTFIDNQNWFLRLS